MQADTVKDGKKVKCANCQHIWKVSKETSEPAPEKQKSIPLVEDKADKRLSDISNEDFLPNGVKPDFSKLVDEMSQRKTFGVPQSISLVLVLILAGLGYFGLLHYQHKIVAAIPGMATVYAMIGAPAIGDVYENLVFDQVSAEAIDDHSYEVFGKILNLSTSPLKLPYISAVALDSHGVMISDKAYFTFQDDMLDAEAVKDFEITVKVSEKPKDFELRFVTEAEGAVSVLDAAGDDHEETPVHEESDGHQ